MMTKYVMPVGYKWGEAYLLDQGSDIDPKTARRILDRAVELFNEHDDRITWVPHTSELLFYFEGSNVANFQQTEYPAESVLEQWRHDALEQAFNEITDTGARPVGNTRGPRPSRKQKMPLTTNVIEGMSIEDLDAKLAMLREKGIAFLAKYASRSFPCPDCAREITGKIGERVECECGWIGIINNATKTTPIFEEESLY